LFEHGLIEALGRIM